MASPRKLKAVASAVESELDGAIAYGKDSPQPTLDVMLAAVYAPHADYVEAPRRCATADLGISG